MKPLAYLCILFYCLLNIGTQATGAPADKTPDLSFEALEAMDFDALMNIKIESVSKKEETLANAAAAVFVISQEDIRRSNATVIPELFRMVPGMQVARIDSNKWAVTSRGSNSRFSNKLLVLIDGRSIYTTYFSGVNWDEHNLVMEDIERIEVIRGPGGTLWGANAVNGVINIITKHSENTLGGMVSAGMGSEEQGIGTFRYGKELAKDKTIRVYGKYYNRDDFAGKPGEPEADSWDGSRGGFRMDWEKSETNAFTFQGDIYKGESNERAKNNVVSGSSTASFNRAVKIDGVNFLSRWKHNNSKSSEMTAQFYFDHVSRRGATTKRSLIDTYDIDFQHSFQFKEKQKIIWGGGQRFVVDSFEDSVAIQLSPSNRLNYITSAFIQDDIQILPNLLKFTIGSKIEFNNYTGIEVQPSARALWAPDPKHSFWAAVSRAVRTPTRAEDSIRINSQFSGTTLIALIGNDVVKSEEVLALELGYRTQAKKNVFLDVALFYNFYNNLQTRERGTAFAENTPSPAHNVSPFNETNEGSGKTYGVELFGKWDVQENWELSAGFTYFKLDLDQVSTSTFVFENAEGNDPEFQWNIRSHLGLPHSFEFDTDLYFVDTLDNINVASYIRLDLRLGWQPTKSYEISISGQNLLQQEHDEFGSESVSFTSGTRVQRSVFAKAIIKF
jgi:iron complex outermembrane receptor protein